MKAIFKPSRYDKYNTWGIDDEPSVIYVQSLLSRINERAIDLGAKYKRYDANYKRWYQ